METKTQNGAAVKNDTAKPVNNAQNGTVKKEVVMNAQTPGAPDPATVEKAQQVALQQQPHVDLNAKTQKELPLDLRLKMVNELHRKSLQRMNLITRMNQLERFEISLLQENDELEENPYQGCKLIIRDDQNREFVTTTPGLIRMTAQYIFMACDKKLAEIESSIVFPGI